MAITFLSRVLAKLFVRRVWLLPLISALTLPVVAAKTPASYEQALELIHAYSGSGDELQRAMALAEGLSKTHPKSGYAQTLYAEAASTWQLSPDGRPAELREQIIAMCDEALKLNPRLAQAHVAKARVLARSSMYGPANTSINAALSLDPALSGALFLRADVFRRTGALADADAWYRKFIDSTPSKSRKANGYGWIAGMYQDAAWYDATNRKAFIAKAREAYEAMLSMDPGGAWRNVNFAVFLNGHAADFDAAETYAAKALGMKEFPMARYHLAAARYQKLWARSTSMTSEAIAEAAKLVADSTRISLTDAIAFSPFSSLVRGRLQELQVRMAPARHTGVMEQPARMVQP